MEDLRRQLERTIEDAGYVAVGLALLGVQRLQVRRRELAEAVERAGDWLAARAAPGATRSGDAGGADAGDGDSGGAGSGGRGAGVRS